MRPTPTPSGLLSAALLLGALTSSALLSSATAQTTPATPAAQTQALPTEQDPRFAPLPALSSERTLKFPAPAWTIDPALQYRALLETDKGKIVLELYPQVAPKAVNNFVFLARNNFYSGVPFHRVLEGFMAQTGDPLGNGSGGPGYGFYVELDSRYGFDKPGVLGMARSQSLYSQGSQFFITFVPYPSLNGQYTVFGQALEGLEVLAKIQRIDPGNPRAGVQPDVLRKVTVYQEVRPVTTLPLSGAEPIRPPATPDAPPKQ